MESDNQILVLLEAALPNVAFDGWSDATFAAAAASVDMSVEEAKSVCPRGAVDLALAYHRLGDERMAEQLAATRATTASTARNRRTAT